MQYKSVEMTGQNLAITFACITILSGCASLDDSFSAYRRNLPDNAPKGYASYLDAQDDLKKKITQELHIIFVMQLISAIQRPIPSALNIPLLGLQCEQPHTSMMTSFLIKPRIKMEIDTLQI